MNEDVITDLKQFIATTVSQETTEIRKEMADMEARLEARLSFKIDVKIDELSASIAEAFETTNDENDERFKNYGRRIARLERKTA